jgi:uncharacterized membrane protein
VEKYKIVLKKRIAILAGLIILAVILEICNFNNVFGNAGSDGFDGGVITGFQTGLISALIGIFIYIIIRYSLAMKDNTKLKKLYNTEHDERRKDIKQKCGGNVVIFSSVIIIFGGIILGNFNQIIFFSLIGCAMFQLNFCAILKLYYSRKY